MPRSYNGWPASKDPKVIEVNRDWEPIKGYKFPGGIKSGDVEVVFTYLVIQLDSRVEPIEESLGDEWGFSFRANVNDPNPNPENMSCHASATAIDYNARRHPNGGGYTWTPRQRAVIHQICNEELGGVVKNLTGYDEMHFEIKGSEADVRAVADRIRNLQMEDDMKLYWVDGISVFVLGNSREENLPQWKINELRKMKIPEQTIDGRTWEVLEPHTGIFAEGLRSLPAVDRNRFEELKGLLGKIIEKVK